jgi:rhodanese-related sulfurtransferase
MSQIEIDIHSVQRWLAQGKNDSGKEIALIDCREPKEYDIAKIQGAILMPMGSWPPAQEALDALDGKLVVVHCHHGGRSLRVASWFRQNGHPDAMSMSGGIDQWSMEIDPNIPRY